MTTSAPANHLETVTAIYEAFGRGDVGAILDQLSPDVRWEDWPSNYAQRAGVPHLAAGRGRDDVAASFALISGWQVDAFEVRDLLASADQVVADVRVAFTLPNGGRYEDEELQLWTFGSDGLVHRLRHYVDTAKHIAAAGGVDTVSAAAGGVDTVSAG